MATPDFERWVAGLLQIRDRAAQLSQGFSQILYRALVHTLHARQFELAALHAGHQCQGRSKGPHRSARITQEQFGLPHRQLAAYALYLNGPTISPLNLTAQYLQRVEHHAGVVRVEQVMHSGLALGECGKQQHAIRDAL